MGHLPKIKCVQEFLHLAALLLNLHDSTTEQPKDLNMKASKLQCVSVRSFVFECRVLVSYSFIGSVAGVQTVAQRCEATPGDEGETPCVQRFSMSCPLCVRLLLSLQVSKRSAKGVKQPKGKMKAKLKSVQCFVFLIER